MTVYIGRNPQNLDAFERLRVSDPATVFECAHRYDLQPLLMESQLTGSGTATHNADESAVDMATTTSSGDKVIRQSKQYCTYQPGKSQLAYVTGALGTAQANVSQRMGYFDGDNGVFLEQTSSGLSIVFRTKVSGSVVDTTVAQSSWNIDKLDGSTASGKTLDGSKSQILVIDLQWLGVGRVRVGFDMDGELLPAHEFLNDNRNTSTYWTTATLPIRYELENTGVAAAPGDMKQICCSVQSEGGLDLNRGFTFGARTSVGNGVTTAEPVLSIRPKTTFNSITNRVGIVPIGFDILAVTNNAYVELIYDGSLVGASWSDVDSESSVEFDTSATSISGGTVIWSGFVSTTSGSRGEQLSPEGLSNILWLTNNIAGDTTTPLTLRCTSFSGTSTIDAALHWTEIR